MTREPRDRERDEGHMRRCLELAARFKGQTTPNPIVGCVITDRAGAVIAEGAHEAAGKDHAEIAALKRLRGTLPAGATLYVNLEPCNHHGRTPPCAPAVRAAKPARVVIGTEDPIEGHGGGIELLRRAGIKVSVGVLRAECERANLPFFTHAIYRRPAWTLKAGITLDGKLCTVAGKSKWITGVPARADAAVLRHQHDAILVGIGTVLADDPRLTTRLVGGRDPQRIVLDSQLRTPPDARLLPRKRGPRTIIACGPKADAAKERALIARGAEVWRVPLHANGRIDLHQLGRLLGDAGIQAVLVEGGAEVHAYMVMNGHADELVLYVAPMVVGGPAKSWVGGAGRASLVGAPRFVFDEAEAVGGDLRITARPAPRPVPEYTDEID